MEQNIILINEANANDNDNDNDNEMLMLMILILIIMLMMKTWITIRTSSKHSDWVSTFGNTQKCLPPTISTHMIFLNEPSKKIP